MDNPLLRVENLTTHFYLNNGSTVEAVKNISFDVFRGETVALVGESGSGKSVSAFSVMQLLGRNAKHPSGKILFKGADILSMDFRERRALRSVDISIIFQEPGAALNPVYKVGDQIAEVLQVHKGLSKKEALHKAVTLLEEVGIDQPEKRIHAYPFELSGGMKQRVMIAMAVACDPDLLIADEPTTALDVTIQAQILRLIKKVQDIHNMGVLLITHDLGVVNEVADRVLVMKDGEIVERADRTTLFTAAEHPYTQQLLAAIPQAGTGVGQAGTTPLVELNDVKVWFPIRQGIMKRTVDHVKAVDGVSFTIHKGETLALVGESGSGKTTLGKALARLVEPTSGHALYEGTDVFTLKGKHFTPYRKKIQVIFQDPANSLDPRMLIKDIISEGLRSFSMVHSEKEVEEQVAQLLKQVELKPETMWRYPHEFSGGQRQRICIARALAVDPDFIICDEATSALDVSVQAEILELLKELQQQKTLTYLFITHNLSVVRHIANRVAVMQKGRIVEFGDTPSLFEEPQKDYTRTLLRSAPSMDPNKPALGIR